MEGQARTLSGLNVLAGIWLIISPFVLHYSSTGNVWQEVIFGIVVGILGIVRLAAPNVSWPSWINLIIGLWMIIAPWTMATTNAAKWSEVITGIIIAALAYSSGLITVESHTTHHHPAH